MKNLLELEQFAIKDDYGITFNFPGAKVNHDIEKKSGCSLSFDDVAKRTGIENLLSLGELHAILELGLQAFENRTITGIPTATIENAKAMLLSSMFMSYTGNLSDNSRVALFGERTRDVIQVTGKKANKIKAYLLSDAVPAGEGYESSRKTQVDIPFNIGRVIKTTDGMYSPHGIPFATKKSATPGANQIFWKEFEKRLKPFVASKLSPTGSQDSLYYATNYNDLLKVDFSDLTKLLRENATFAVPHRRISDYMNLMRGTDAEFFGFTYGDPLCFALGQAKSAECGLGYRLIERNKK